MTRKHFLKGSLATSLLLLLGGTVITNALPAPWTSDGWGPGTTNGTPIAYFSPDKGSVDILPMPSYDPANGNDAVRVLVKDMYYSKSDLTNFSKYWNGYGLGIDVKDTNNQLTASPHLIATNYPNPKYDAEDDNFIDGKCEEAEVTCTTPSYMVADKPYSVTFEYSETTFTGTSYSGVFSITSHVSLKSPTGEYNTSVADQLLTIGYTTPQ
jgi:hypothetical protein